MPLLKKKPFVKLPLPLLLRDDDEVFYCEMTGEIFKDYEEFSERMFLCTSMVWTCSITGKSNLTYAEALESEKSAKKSLGDFPKELQMPMLYIANHLGKTAFGELVDEVFLYVKDRYFLGEHVETNDVDGKWKNACIRNVIALTESQIKNNGNHENPYHPINLYKYELELPIEGSATNTEMVIVNGSKIRRKRGQFTRDKCRVFLKLHLTLGENRFLTVKQSAVKEFDLNNIKLSKMFIGLMPKIIHPKNNNKFTNGKKVKQEPITKYFSNNNQKNNFLSKKQSTLLDQMKKRQEELKKRKEEMLVLKKQRKKEAVIELANRLKHWYRPKEDLELEDHKMLPKPKEVKSEISNEYLADVFMLMEFIYSFRSIFKMSYFPKGITLETMEKALIAQEVGGPLVKLVQMFLEALFELQEEDIQQGKMQLENILEKDVEENNDDLDLYKGSLSATLASSWCVRHQGIALNNLPLYSLSIPEILRQHFLSSGARIIDSNGKWQTRGNYTNESDPGLAFCINEPQIIYALSYDHLVQLSLADKLKVLTCLMNQILTYEKVRNRIEKRLEESKQAKIELKRLIFVDKKCEDEHKANVHKFVKEEKDANTLSKQLELLESENKKKHEVNEKKLNKLATTAYSEQIVLGQDRAFRRYFKFESVPGLFVCMDVDFDSHCLNEIVHKPKLVDADHKNIVEYLKKLIRKMNSSDKENDPLESLTINGECVTLDSDFCNNLLICTSNPNNCIVHSKTLQKWCFFETSQIDELINALNIRGIRERKLHQVLKNARKYLIKVVSQTPVKLLNNDDNAHNKFHNLRTNNQNKKNEDTFGFPDDMPTEDVLKNTIVDIILELEEKIFTGGLGQLSVNRKNWRSALEKGNFDILKELIMNDINNKHMNTEKNNYHDPAYFLYKTIDLELSIDEKRLNNINILSMALVQVAHALNKNYLKKPLGCVSTTKLEHKNKIADRLNNWEESLLASTSYSQIFVHYGTFDQCVMWSKSALKAKCLVCKKGTFADSILLCDSCNSGYHFFCLNPRLKRVPEGDWFCKKCAPEQQIEESPQQELPSEAQKIAPIFRDEQIIETLDDKGNENQINGTITADDSDKESGICDSSTENNICKKCKQSGDLLHCIKCKGFYHCECVDLRRAPRGLWTCPSCKDERTSRTYRKRRDSGSDWNQNGEQQINVLNGQRRCAAKAISKIHDFAKSLREYESSDDEHFDNTSDESEESEADEVISKRSSSLRRINLRSDRGSDLPLHNAALQELLTEIMKDNNAWPFLRPVQKTEVPDYYDVITKPMDFGTIKYKLNMGEYKEDADLMADAVLVFQNCNTYNHTEDDVYKCGVQLLKHFQQKVRELGLKLPKEMDYYSNENNIPKKRMRIV